MRRIKTLTRPKVMSARVRQTLFLDILEKPLRMAADNLLGMLNLQEDKEEEP